jgi:hypothetical protein
MVERYRPKQTVGYKQPPEHSRFKKGQSGNPRGRRRKTVTVADVVAEELQSTVFISENGQRIKINKLRLFFKQALNRAISGNSQSFVHAMKIADALERINRFSAKSATTNARHVDISKLSLDEKIQKLKEMIGDSKPLDQY